MELSQSLVRELEEKEKRVHELESLLSDPEVVSKTELFRQYAREHAQLSKAVNKFRKYRRIKEEMRSIETELASDEDAELKELASSELVSLRADISSLTRELEDFIYVEDPEAERNIIMEIRAGTGGIEAALFAAELYRMYTKYAVRKNWKAEVLSSSLSEKNGFKEVIFSISGEGVYKNLKYESGTHRVQRVPVTETSGRIHTSAVTVAVLPEAEDVEVDIKPDDLKIDVFRAGGRGGQHVNVTDSAVRITHISTGLVVSCQDERSQHKNKAKAMKVLKARLYDLLKREQTDKVTKERKKQVGSGDRSEKIRTYNFPDRRITDHRINLTIHGLHEVLEGDLDEIIESLRDAERKLILGEKDR